MSKVKKSDFILVFDRYYSKKPSAFLLWLKRTVYCCAECACMMLCLLEIYKVPSNSLTVTACCVTFTAFFCTLFTFVRKRFAVPAVLLLIMAGVYHYRDILWGMMKYFLDALMLALDGPVFSLTRYLYHDGNVPAGTISLILMLIASLMAIICAASMFKKPSGIPPLITFIILFVPMLAARKLSFVLWVIPTAALLLGGFAMAKAFSSGVITRGGIYSGCRGTLLQEEKLFGKQIAKVPVIKRAKLGVVHYSKYFSASMCAAAVFTLAGFVGAAIMNDRSGIDYTPVYDFFNDIGKQFASIGDSKDDSDSDDIFAGGSFSLSVNTPEKGDDEILSIINTGQKAYLRGDIGVDFDGENWTSPVDAEENVKYFPNEIATLWHFEYRGKEDFPEIAEQMESYGIDTNDYTADKTKVIVDYLADSDVAFLPAYMSDFQTYYYSSFEHYSDYVLRFNGERIDELICEAYEPSLDYTGAGFAQKQIIMNMLNSIVNEDDFYFNTLYSDFKIRDVEYPEYVDYVRKTYLNVPENMRGFLKDFLISNELYTDSTYNPEIYKNCIKITDFLKNRYTYSLDTDNGSENPVMTFLTETKNGHCALYASAMTLMLRTMGVPARYCTGFMAPHTGNNSPVVLKSKNFHAWCEVYFEKIGWVTFDPTSSAATTSIDYENESSSEDSASSDSEISVDSEMSADSEDSDRSFDISDIDDEESEDEEIGDDLTDSDDTSFGGDDEDNADILPFVFTALAVILTGAVVFIIVFKLKELDRAAKNALNEAGDCEEVYAKIIAVLKLCKFEQNVGEQPEAFFLRVDGKLKTKFSDNIETLMKTAFGSGKFTDNERTVTAKLLNELFKTADDRLIAVGRVKLRKIIIGKHTK